MGFGDTKSLRKADIDDDESDILVDDHDVTKL